MSKYERVNVYQQEDRRKVTCRHMTDFSITTESLRFQTTQSISMSCLVQCFFLYLKIHLISKVKKMLKDRVFLKLLNVQPVIHNKLFYKFYTLKNNISFRKSRSVRSYSQVSEYHRNTFKPSQSDLYIGQTPDTEQINAN